MSAVVPCCEHCRHPLVRMVHTLPCVGCLKAARDQAAERDEARIRAELRDRLDRCDDNDHGAAFGWLTDNHPDIVREALDETGAPT